MTTDHRRVDAELVQEVLLCERVVQQILEAVMTEHIGGAAPYERLEGRTGHRNGHQPRMLRTRVGTLNLVVPQDREGTFSNRKVKDVTEALCGDSPLRCVSCSCKVFVVHLLRNTFVKSFLA
jgi:transposase-like protein